MEAFREHHVFQARLDTLSDGIFGVAMTWLILDVRLSDDFHPRRIRQRECFNWWLLYLLLITCVPFTIIAIGRLGHFAAAIWLQAGHTLLISLVGIRLVLITPHLEQGNHLRQRQMSAVLLMASSRLAIALSFLNPRVALWALALNSAAPLLKKWGGRAALPD